MRTISTTRMQLLAHKASITLAKQGRDLLEQKRTALMKEFSRMAEVVMGQSDALEQAAINARKALARAEADAGPEALRSVALATRSEFPLKVGISNVMGVKVPDIEVRQASRSPLARGYGTAGTSLTIDDAAGSFENEVDAILLLAASELRLTRMADEIQRTSRRVNALEHLLIPRLEAERDFIQLALDERERSDRFRLKLVKRLLQRKREEAGTPAES